jgi:hypothetical protein
LLRLDAGNNGLLPDIEVAEAADQAHSIELARLFLKAADQKHLVIEFFHFLGRRFGGGA